LFQASGKGLSGCSNSSTFTSLHHDSFGTAERELEGIVQRHILIEPSHDIEKDEFVRSFDLSRVAASGNGNNDRLLLKVVKEGGGLACAPVRWGATVWEGIR
jgi:hypothetical protein